MLAMGGICRPAGNKISGKQSPLRGRGAVTRGLKSEHAGASRAGPAFTYLFATPSGGESMTPRCWTMTLTLALLTSLFPAIGQAAAGDPLPAAAGYNLVDIGGLGGAVTPAAINLRNQVAGSAVTAA